MNINRSKKSSKEVDTQKKENTVSNMPKKGYMRIDLHCHTEASWDCISDIKSFPEELVKKNISVQAITDHNEISGAIELKKIVKSSGLSVQIIIGEEVLTSEGEIIGLYLKEKIPGGLTARETVRRIKEQGGLVLLPHGFDKYKRYRLKKKVRDKIVKEIDIVETFNTRVSNKRYNELANEFAKKYQKVESSGSDAHTFKDVGTAWTEVPNEIISGPEDLLEALKKGKPQGKWVHPARAYLYKMWDMTRNMLYKLR